MNWSFEEFTCFEEGCGRIFSTKWTLKRHSAMHQRINNSTYKCEKCDKRFSRKDSLDRHHQICHSSEIMMYVCPEVDCGKLFNLKSTLYRHMFSHTVTYGCEECGSSFTRKDNLARHKIMHVKPTKESKQSKTESTQKTNEMKKTTENMDYNDDRGDHTYSIFAG